MKIKICGITQEDNMHHAAALAPDYMGFIFYPPSPRDVSGKISTLPMGSLPGNIKKVAVLVNMPLQQAVNLVQSYRFDLVQLHGNESPGYCTAMRKNVPVIKAFSIKDSLPDDLRLYEECCDYFLFDTKTDKPGGSGMSFDHTVLNSYALDVPFFLSGGIRPEHAAHLKTIENPRLFALDVNSKFETSPGVKDVALLNTFIQKLKSTGVL
jgi:phosphoribosylanthranilate isomerase